MGDLGEKFKTKEAKFDVRLPTSKYFVIRVDGNNFHSLAKRHFISPFDSRVVAAHKFALYGIIKKFGPVAAYGQSDEMSIIFAPTRAPKTAPYGNRVQKLLSLVASTYSVRFTKAFTYLRKMSVPHTFDGTENTIFLKAFILHSNAYNSCEFGLGSALKNMGKEVPSIHEPNNFSDFSAIFDARALVLDSIGEVREYVTWRRIDAIRNAKMSLARTFFSHKDLLCVSSDDAVMRLNEEYGVDYRKLPAAFKIGIVYDKTGRRIAPDFKEADFCEEF